MGEDQGAAGASLSAEPRNPEDIRESIAQTREELGDTVAALAQKTDVRAMAREKAALVRLQAEHAVRTRMARIQAQVRAKPAPAAVGAVAAAGLLVWRLRRR